MKEVQDQLQSRILELEAELNKKSAVIEKLQTQLSDHEIQKRKDFLEHSNNKNDFYS